MILSGVKNNNTGPRNEGSGVCCVLPRASALFLLLPVGVWRLAGLFKKDAAEVAAAAEAALQRDLAHGKIGHGELLARALHAVVQQVCKRRSAQLRLKTAAAGARA